MASPSNLWNEEPKSEGSSMSRIPVAPIWLISAAARTGLAVSIFLPLSVTASSASDITFTDLTESLNSGLLYSRARSENFSLFDALTDPAVEPNPPFTVNSLAGSLPLKPFGAPGICIFDYDNDGDQDIFVSNGPGAANSLFSNQLQESGQVSFLDKAMEAGVGLDGADSGGCAAGDIDNDGDKDLYVTDSTSINRLLENQGDGTFQEITGISGAGGSPADSSYSVTMGDVNNDGLLDIAVGNTTRDNTLNAITFFLPEETQHNSLFLNLGGNSFLDVSAQAGFQQLDGLEFIDEQGDRVPLAVETAGITWAVALVDYDLDGDLDFFAADDQGGVRSIGQPEVPSFLSNDQVNRGIVHVHDNNGHGQFTDVSPDAGTNMPGPWMGLSFADYDSDGHMDFFGSNFGDVDYSINFGSPLLGVQSSRWFLADGAGGFIDSVGPDGVQGLISMPFGWGTSSADYDNDGCTDILYVGSFYGGPTATLTNPLAILRNDCQANFTADLSALSAEGAAKHRRRLEHGMAVGDLNNDGFLDIVTVAAADVPDLGPLIVPNQFDFGGPYDLAAEFVPVLAPAAEPGTFDFVPSVYEFQPGSLSVEISSGNANGWVSVELVGGKDLVDGANVNRDGIGAVVQFTPQGGGPAMQPVIAGSSYASQDSLIKQFGLGQATAGTLDILWPGGVRNRLHLVGSGERLLVPEIPCSIDSGMDVVSYLECVGSSTEALRGEGVIDVEFQLRLFLSAVTAYFEER